MVVGSSPICRASNIIGLCAKWKGNYPVTIEYAGSIPVGPAKNAVVVQLVRMLACHASGHGFESHLSRQFLYYYRAVGDLVRPPSCHDGVCGFDPRQFCQKIIWDRSSVGQNACLSRKWSWVRIPSVSPKYFFPYDDDIIFICYSI